MTKFFKGPMNDPALYTLDLERSFACVFKWYCPVKGRGQLDLPFMTPLSIAGCGRPQLGAANWAISVALLHGIVDN